MQIVIKSAFRRRRNTILTSSSDSDGETEMMTHFSLDPRCQPHRAHKSRMHKYSVKIWKKKKAKSWRNTLSAGVVELAVVPNHVTCFPILVFSTTALRQFCDGESGIKSPLKLLPKGKVCPCASGRKSPWANVPHIKLKMEEITNVPVILCELLPGVWIQY